MIAPRRRLVGDLAGFASAIVRRGMHLVQVPTSLLAQVDSSVGGKTGINTPRGQEPRRRLQAAPAWCWPTRDVLDTLPKREFAAGYAEIVKYGLIDKPDFFDWLEAHWSENLRGRRRAPQRGDCASPARPRLSDIVARDELENGDRALLNLATHSATPWRPPPPMTARVWCMAKVSRSGWSWRTALPHGSDWHRESDAARVEAHLSRVALPTHLGDRTGRAASRRRVDGLYCPGQEGFARVR